MGRTTRSSRRRNPRAGGNPRPVRNPDGIHLEHPVPSMAAAAEAIRGAPPRGAVPRCPDPATGDAGRNSGGTSLVLTGDLAAAGRIRVDWEQRAAVVPAGVPLLDLIPKLLRSGWFLPVAPDRLSHTVGACIATDARGQVASGAGGFADHVADMDLVDGSGMSRTLEPVGPTAREFWATVGGLGLTGLITRVTLRVRPVTSAWLIARSLKCRDLDAVLGAMTDATAGPAEARYVVARLDPGATGASTGRGVVVASDHAPVAALPAARQAHALDFEPTDEATSPIAGWRRRLTGLGLRAAHGAWFHAAPHETADKLLPAATTLFRPLQARSGSGGRPADSIRYEFSVPHGSADVIGRCLSRMSSGGATLTDAELRRCDSDNRAALVSTAPRGWVARFEVTADARVGPDLDAIDEMVAEAGGMVRLASDRRMRPEIVPVMYPAIDEWRGIRVALDPHARLQSDLGRRLGL